MAGRVLGAIGGGHAPRAGFCAIGGAEAWRAGFCTRLAGYVRLAVP